MIHHTKLEFTEELDELRQDNIEYIILHHTADSKPHDVYDVHKAQINKGMAGIAYHYFISKDGEIYEGRPLNAVGAHTRGYNRESIGVCFEGDFNEERMDDEQLNASVMLLSILSLAHTHDDFAESDGPRYYVETEDDVDDWVMNPIVRHDDLVQGQVPSPGKLFPYGELLRRVRLCREWLIALFGRQVRMITLSDEEMRDYANIGYPYERESEEGDFDYFNLLEQL